jgi:hypothetical protein
MHALIKCLVVTTVLAIAFFAFEAIQDAKQDAKPAGGMPPGPEPTAEHKWLADGAGKWKATGKVFVGPGQEMPLSGVQTNTMQPGGLWQITDFKEDTGPFVGHGIAGYDPAKKKFVSVWVDSMGTELAPAEGTLSADKKTLTMEFMATGPTGEKEKMKETITRKDDKTSFFEMFKVGADGKQMKVLEITYTKM